MVPGGVFGLPHPARDEVDDDSDPDVDLGLDGLDDDLLDVGELYLPPPDKPVRP
jgi:hypothetical protein